MKFSQRVERFTAYYDRRTVGYNLPGKDAIGLADYSKADQIRQQDFDKKWKRSFKKAYGVSARTSKQNAPSGTGKG